MANTLEFNNWDENSFKDDYDKNFNGFKEKMLNAAKSNPNTSHSLFKRAILWFAIKYVHNESSFEELSYYMKLAMQAAYAHIQTEVNLGTTQELWIDNEKVSLQKTSSTHKTNVATLMEINDITCICRCEKVKEAIFRQTDPGPFFHNVNLARSYHYPYYYLEKSLHKIDDAVIQRQLDKMDKSAEDFFKDDDEWNDWYEAIYLPLSALRNAFYLGNEASFNEKLQIALDKDRAFNDDAKGRYANPDNWIPWEINAFACRAHDKGWNITVNDSRLLMFLVEGKCNVENLAP
ncbi:immunity protein 49 of polymorphic toxin system [Kordia periserrulae]|uniref:Immunity protein 49 of polymorphic toxin system n=1 Tax=Kordia periserrulae TaxID=701523 RepID=A0A2T6C4C6_9FLAO|nr:Imm49 family immunity protein [Kordia periserrulae]PTX63137.1 immunity protein 49 of polymorphic toxin system [Kordia periserrulae]